MENKNTIRICAAKVCLLVLVGMVLPAAGATTTNTLIATGAPVLVLVPTSSAQTNFYLNSYVPDTNWISGKTGVGYGNNFTAFIGTNIQSLASNKNASFYMRQTFTLQTSAGISNLTLRIKFDDGFVAYLNGTKVASSNNPALPLWNSVATNTPANTNFVSYVITNKSLMLPGTNVLAIQGLNLKTNDNDLLILPELLAVGTLPVLTNLPPEYISTRSAAIQAQMTDSGGDTVTVRFAWGLTDGGTVASAWTNLVNAAPSDIVENGYFAELTGLTPGTTYYYRAFGINGVGTNWAFSTASFTTPPVTLPSIDRIWASAISRTAAGLNGELSGDGGETPEAHIVWGNENGGTNSPGGWDHDVNLGRPQEGQFYTYISGLTANTIYYFAAYVSNSAGRVWKAAEQFTTPGTDPIITEFMADNTTTLADGFGNFPDWIEIYNPLDTPQALTGWYLTDTTNNLTKWKFPSLTLSPNQYLIVFASGRNTNDPLGYLHTSFSLSAGGEYLALVRPDGTTVVSEYTFPAQQPNVSCGWSPDGTQVRYFATPTPGTNNNTAYWDLVKNPQFSVQRGFYTNSFHVAITTATANAIIRYTRDGSWPTESNGTVYSSVVTITNTTVLRAIAYYTNGPVPFESSPVGAQTYIFLNDIVKQPANPPGWPAKIVYWNYDPFVKVWSWKTNNAPNWGVKTNATMTQQMIKAALTNSLTISLSTGMGMLFETNTGLFAQMQPVAPMDHSVSVEIFDPAGGSSTQLTASVRPVGNVWSGYPDKTKISMRLLFKSEFTDKTTGQTFHGPGKLKYPVFPDTKVDTFNTLVLRGLLQCSLISPWAGSDAIRDAYMHRRFSDMGYNDVHYRYVHVYINGLYFGVFQAQERPDDAFMASYFGGNSEDYDNLKQGYKNNNYDDPVMVIDPPGTEEAWSNLCNLVPVSSGFSNGEPAKVISPENYQIVKNNYLDMERFADYMLLEMLCGNYDWPVKNYYVNCRRGDPAYGPPALKWMPFTWDGDLAMRQDQGRVTNDYFGVFTNTAPNAQTAYSPLGRIWNAFYGRPEWKRFFGDRVQKHMFNGGELTIARLNGSWLAARDEYLPMVAGEICKWAPTITIATWTNSVSAVTTNFWPTRYSHCLVQLRTNGFLPYTDAPVYSQHGGTVTNGFGVLLTNPNGSGSIWYTTDDSDPRDGGAIQYTGSPVTISATTRFKACVSNSTEWSAMNEAIFQVVPTLEVSEIMYNPPAGGAYDAQEYEFIEFHNTGTNTVDLSPVRLTNGIEFAFAGSSVTNLARDRYVVVVRNRAAFSERYTMNSIRIAGEYSGTLDNGGEQIGLSEKYDQPILAFAYDDAWYPSTDGGGYSLVKNDPAPGGDPGTSNYWRASMNSLGSPGGPDTDDHAVPVLITEALTHTDWPQTDTIELYNPTNVAVNLGGWWLSDDLGAPKKFSIPANTLIQPYSYLVIYEDNDADTNNVPPAEYFGGAFSLNSHGEEVWLSSPSLSWMHGFRFGAAANGVSFGRYVTSDGQEHFPAQQTLTLGSANSGPRVGPLVITEIMYYPPTNRPEYLELKNISGAPLKLYDELHPSNVWSFTEGLGFVFPTGIVVQPGQYVVLSETNEAAFRAAWNACVDAQVFGPYTGKLDNGGETLEFSRPDNPDPDGTVSLISVERLKYQNFAPWPVGVNGTGASLERIADGSFGSDPANWRASSTNVTPGDYPQVDLDADGLPDNWEMKHFGQLDHPLGGPDQDADGDGISNFREYILGTDPRAANSDFTGRITIRNGAVELEFDTAVTAGQSGYFGLRRIYEVQQRVPAVTSVWESLPAWTNIPATGARVTVTNQPVRLEDWYRIRAALE